MVPPSGTLLPRRPDGNGRVELGRSWHLAEVHGFWARIVDGLLAAPSAADEFERPADPALQAFAAELGAAGVEELVRGFLVGVPGWARWTPGGTTVAPLRRCRRPPRRGGAP
jgi:hypothetical protein